MDFYSVASSRPFAHGQISWCKKGKPSCITGAADITAAAAPAAVVYKFLVVLHCEYIITRNSFVLWTTQNDKCNNKFTCISDSTKLKLIVSRVLDYTRMLATFTNLAILIAFLGLGLFCLHNFFLISFC